MRNRGFSLEGELEVCVDTCAGQPRSLPSREEARPCRTVAVLRQL